MWGAKDSKDDDNEEKDSENMMFKPVRPRRERLEEDAADEKENSGAGDEAMGDTKGRRRRVEEDEKKEEAPVGWMTSPNKNNNRNRLKIEEDEAESMANTKNNKHFGDEFDDGIMLIPDLDEDNGEQEVDNRVAQAPRHVPRKIPTLAELEEGMKSTVPMIDGNYDLGVLTRTLVPLESCQESNEAWEFDSLLREVTDELTNTPKTVVSATISTTAVEKGNNSAKNNKKGKGKASKK